METTSETAAGTRAPIRLRECKRECACKFQPGDRYCAECDDTCEVDCTVELCDCRVTCCDCAGTNCELRGEHAWCLDCDRDALDGEPLTAGELTEARK